MRYVLTFLMFCAVASAQMLQSITNDVAVVAGGATATLIQHPVVDCVGTVSTCAVTVSSTGTGHLLVITAAGGGATATITGISAGGTFVPCTGCTVTGAATGVSLEGGWVLSSTSGVTSITVTFSTTLGHPVVSIAEYSCTGTISHDVDGTVDSSSNTSPFPGVALTLAGTNDVITQWAGGVAVDPTAISGAYTAFIDHPAAGFAFAAAINTVVGTAPNWTAAGNAGGDTGAAIAMKCQ